MLTRQAALMIALPAPASLIAQLSELQRQYCAKADAGSARHPRGQRRLSRRAVLGLRQPVSGALAAELHEPDCRCAPSPRDCGRDSAQSSWWTADLSRIPERLFGRAHVPVPCEIRRAGTSSLTGPFLSAFTHLRAPRGSIILPGTPLLLGSNPIDSLTASGQPLIFDRIMAPLNARDPGMSRAILFTLEVAARRATRQTTGTPPLPSYPRSAAPPSPSRVTERAAAPAATFSDSLVFKGSSSGKRIRGTTRQCIKEGQSLHH